MVEKAELGELLTPIIEARWKEAVADPTILRWRSLREMAEDLAACIHETEPDNIMVPALMGVADAAHARMTALMPGVVG
ncbi:hypothetical protein [Immundisolibacter sp.]